MIFHKSSAATGGLERSRTSGAPAEPAASIQLDVGRTLALVIVSLALIGAATVLWLNKLDTPGAAVFALGEAVLASGFGIVFGERSAAAGG